MDPKKITELANLLRDNGDKVLSSEFKLTVTGSLLRALNDSFKLIADSTELGASLTFQVVKPYNSQSNVFRDLQLIYDFIQKTLYLCITHYPGEDYYDGVIDISKFRSLKRLEVHKVCIKQVVGIQPLRSQLEQVICTRSLKSIVDIITHCGGDNTNGFVWNELKMADFSYNNLKVVDSSLEFAQYLQHLSLRHNQLVSVEAIKWLPNLKTLDLSYNNLTYVPQLHLEPSTRLQALNLSNNLIEDLKGISKLESLTDLDLSDNCLLDHNCLYPLSTLINLKVLYLCGNPLYCHPKHRLATAQFLHKNTSTVKFMLDFIMLSKQENALTGTHHKSSQAMFASRYMNKSSSRAVGNRLTSSTLTLASSTGSTTSFPLNSESENSVIDPHMNEKNKRKARVVIIENILDTSAGSQLVNSDKDTKPPIERNVEHLETKKQIESLREKYGAGWLQNENAQMVRGVLGLSPSLDSTQNSENKATGQQAFDSFLSEINVTRVKGDDYVMVVTSGHNDSLHVSAMNVGQLSPNASDDIRYSTASPTLLDEKENQTLYQSATENLPSETEDNEVIDNTPHLKDVYANSVDEPEISDTEDDEATYIVKTAGKTESIFLTVSPNYIREKDTSSQKTKTKWSLKILESCERIKSDTLRINFDTIKADKQERIYTVEEGLCQELEKKFRDILSKRDLSEMNQKVYRCINCNCKFSRENTFNEYRKQDLICPDCNSSFVAEVHNTSLLYRKETPHQSEAIVGSVDVAVEVEEACGTSPVASQTNDRRDSSNERENSLQDSIEVPSGFAANEKLSSAHSLNGSSSCSKISCSDNSFDSSQSAVGSVVVDRENEIKSNSESDVDILSNPSQSSIEVLDQQNESRKNSCDYVSVTSSEGKTTTDSPRIVPLADNKNENQFSEKRRVDEAGDDEKKNILGQTLLTESSSSGSVADSVCTTYEQQETARANKNHEDFTQKFQPLPEESSKKEESVLSSMFGGLILSTNMLMSRTSQRVIEAETSQKACEKYKFNYDDFLDIDHRLKLYFYQTKFENKGEDFQWMVKGKILNENTGALFDGLVVMSTVRCFLIEAFAPENDNVSKWLRPIVSVTADRVQSIQSLPWKIGFAFTLRDWGGFLLLLQDILRTDSLQLHFAKNDLLNGCEINYQVPQRIQNCLSTSVGEEQLKMFSLLNTCEVILDDNIQKLPVRGLLTTDTRLCITTGNLSWLSQQSDVSIEFSFHQLMSNLVEVERPQDNVITIHFLDETQGKAELWKCTFETKDNTESCLSAIGQSWEKLFGIPLCS